MWTLLTPHSWTIYLTFPWLIPPPASTLVLLSLYQISLMALRLLKDSGASLPPWVSTSFTPSSSSIRTVSAKLGVKSDALWKVTFMAPPHSLSTSPMKSRLAALLPASKAPTTTPAGLNLSLNSAISSSMSLVSAWSQMNPLLWCLTMTCVGMETASRHRRRVMGEGVTPPTSRADTNSMRSAPRDSTVRESAGLVAMTSRKRGEYIMKIYKNMLVQSGCLSTALTRRHLGSWNCRPIEWVWLGCGGQALVTSRSLSLNPPLLLAILAHLLPRPSRQWHGSLRVVLVCLVPPLRSCPSSHTTQQAGRFQSSHLFYQPSLSSAGTDQPAMSCPRLRHRPCAGIGRPPAPPACPLFSQGRPGTSSCNHWPSSRPLL